MKLAVTCTGQSLDDQVDPRFGRCGTFLLVDSDSMECEPLDNSHAQAGGGAGIRSAQTLADKDVQVVLTGNCGPNAFRTLEAAGIRVFTGQEGTARAAVQRFLEGNLKSTEGPNVGSHFGTGGTRA